MSMIVPVAEPGPGNGGGKNSVSKSWQRVCHETGVQWTGSDTMQGVSSRVLRTSDLILASHT